ncbi:hypothetical protein B0H10DRAFT_1984517 [Mycena sp. CBHHK59/15]|nr:hypothetical protein B0H10DRAFT_1984517 [Mycena sp. CBHHK59/15]
MEHQVPRGPLARPLPPAAPTPPGVRRAQAPRPAPPRARVVLRAHLAPRAPARTPTCTSTRPSSEPERPPGAAALPRAALPHARRARAPRRAHPAHAHPRRRPPAPAPPRVRHRVRVRPAAVCAQPPRGVWVLGFLVLGFRRTVLYLYSYSHHIHSYLLAYLPLSLCLCLALSLASCISDIRIECMGFSPLVSFLCITTGSFLSCVLYG